MNRIPRMLALALTCTALIACQKSEPPAPRRRRKSA